MKRNTGDLYIFEGPDAVGKSTLATAFADALRELGRKVTVTSSPGKTAGTLGELVYRLHHDPESFGVTSICPASLQTLHVAAHIDALEREIRPLLLSGTDVVLDRCWMSTLVYGRVAGVDHATLDKMISLELESWSGLRPQSTYLIATNHPLRDDCVGDAWEALASEYKTIVKGLDPSWRVRTVLNNTDVHDWVRKALRYVPKTTAPKSQAARQSRSAVNSLRPVIPTKVYDTYWSFAAERQNVLFAKLGGGDPPYTDDRIIAQHRFTNAYRVADRVSQYLIQHVIEGSEDDPDDLFFRIILFKTFNKIKTWEHLVSELGEPRWADYEFTRYDHLLGSLSEAGHSIYSAAYIMPSGGKAFGFRRKHQNHLALIEAMVRDRVPSQVSDATSMKTVFEILCSYPMIGPFLGYQYATDINYSPLTDFSEMEFVIPGPGAKDGIRKCFSNLGGLSESEIIRLVAERQDHEFVARDLEFRRLGDRPLQLIDCQNLFCEVDKYARVAHPDVQGISGRTRIKQQYRPDPRPFRIVLPAKWGTTSLEEPKEHGNAGLLFR